MALCAAECSAKPRTGTQAASGLHCADSQTMIPPDCSGRSVQQAVSPGKHREVTVIAAPDVTRYRRASADHRVEHHHFSPHDACVYTRTGSGCQLYRHRLHTTQTGADAVLAQGINKLKHLNGQSCTKRFNRKMDWGSGCTFVRHGQPAQAVVAVDVHTGVIQHDVRTEPIQVRRQPLCQAPGMARTSNQVASNSGHHDPAMRAWRPKATQSTTSKQSVLWCWSAGITCW